MSGFNGLLRKIPVNHAGDVLTAVFLVLLGLGLTFSGWSRTSMVEFLVLHPGGRMKLRANHDISIQVQGKISPVTIEVASGRARIAHSDCPRHYCMNAGWISHPGQTVACVPNRVMIKAEGKPLSGMPDAVSE